MGPMDCRVEHFTDWQGPVVLCSWREGGHFLDSDIFSLEGLYLRSDPETSPSDLLCPDLSFWGVSEHLEASFIRAKIVGFDSIQEGVAPLGDSTFGGAPLGISV
jgi:hypothetical protein